MSTLFQPPLDALLERLFADAEAALPADNLARVGLDAAEHARLMSSKTEYRDYYGRMKDLPLPVSRDTGRLLYMLARASRARSIVEFGTSFGISTLHLAAALRDNGGGRIISTEFEPSKIARARGHFDAAGVADLIEVREGDALQTLARDLPAQVDLLLLDGAKALYPQILAMVGPHLRPGAFVLADNAEYSPDYLAFVRDPGNGYLSVPFAEDVELSQRLA